MSVEERVEKLFEGISREEFKQLLEDSGFEVTDGDGRIFDGNNKDITDEIISSIK